MTTTQDQSQLPFGFDVGWYTSEVHWWNSSATKSQLPFGFEIDWHFDAVAQERDPPARLYVVKDFKDRIAGNGERPPGTATNLPFTGAWFNSVTRQNIRESADNQDVAATSCANKAS